MKLRDLATSGLALALISGSAAAFAQGYGAPPPPPPGYGQGQGGWDVPPQEYRQYQQQGFREGIEAARSDYQYRKPFNVNARDEMRHPNVPREVRGDFREGFKKGYYAAASHLQGGGGQ